MYDYIIEQDGTDILKLYIYLYLFCFNRFDILEGSLDCIDEEENLVQYYYSLDPKTRAAFDINLNNPEIIHFLGIKKTILMNIIISRDVDIKI